MGGPSGIAMIDGMVELAVTWKYFPHGNDKHRERNKSNPTRVQQIELTGFLAIRHLRNLGSTQTITPGLTNAKFLMSSDVQR